MINKRFLKFEMLAQGFFFNSSEKLGIVEYVVDIIARTRGAFIVNPYFTINDHGLQIFMLMIVNSDRASQTKILNENFCTLSFKKPEDIVGHYDEGTFDNAKEI